MSNNTTAPVTVDSDGPSAPRPAYVSDAWKLTAPPTVDGPSPSKINLALLPAYVAPIVAARLGVPAPGRVTEGRTPDCMTDNPSGTCEGHTHAYSDGYGGTYGVGE